MTNKPSSMTDKVQTVLGPIEPSEMGVTITHEHLFIDMKGYSYQPEEATKRALWNKPYTMDMVGSYQKNAWFTKDIMELYSEEAATEEIRDFMLAGGGTVVDTTNWDLGRDPLALARVSRATGLNIIMGCSHYVPLLRPADMDDRTEDSIYERIVADVTVGVGDTGIKSGVIGEVGNVHPLDDNQTKVLRASARAHLETGAPISIHPGGVDESPMAILEVLAEAGVDLTKVIMGHLDFAVRDTGALKAIAETGCVLEYDTIGAEDSGMDYMGIELRVPTDAERLTAIDFLVEQGYEDRIVLAQDVCFKRMQARTGGHGFAHILESIVPRLLKRDYSRDQIDGFLVRNPARALAYS
jgi:phosphotriesterase-related protein